MTVAIIITAVISFGVTAGLGFVIIPWLKRLKFGQTILDIGPSWHKSKQGTPNMGGLMFIIGIVSAFAVGALTFTLSGGSFESDYAKVLVGRDNVLIISGLFLAFGCGVVGFADDYIKIKLKRNEGLTAKQKTLGQLIVTVGYTMTLWASHNTVWFIPFFGNVNFEKNFITGVIFWILSIFIIYGCVNSVNLTDGIDGLCSSVTATVAVSFIVASFILRFAGLGILSGALLGGVLGFLCWNRNPAKVFMGDTGSLFLGGLVAAMGYALKCPLLLLPIGIIYVTETMSDIIQIGYFKLTHGKRVFKMAPIHHHFEMCGLNEKKICIVFSAVNVLGCAVGLILLYFGRK
ncbi:MAG: phospho-N-acetylmuramoyl-pentapeptide-transferase [Clostridiales bacterium]|nr:phospho-N-acetylmuramoyl-pentapeptide-transferase [Clostridiales bacterium]MBD8930021.1 phospho-N-acetylmuramoyl-pentapeptide-transferase [Clostridiales bacterium]MBD8930069.1 phospho-N-acetylmuramoyl-pentapeptide-transferase [Clostridiales bacterium]